MRPRLVCCAVLFAGIVLSGGGCVSLGCPVPSGIPVRRLPDEILHCPPVVDNQQQTATLPGPNEGIKSSFDFLTTPACGVFYTGGGLGSGEYPLKYDLRVTDAVALVRGPIYPNHLRPAASRVTILRHLTTGQQIPIRVDLNEALCDPRENIPLWPGDLLLTNETCCQSACRAWGGIFHVGKRVEQTCDSLPGSR